MTLQQLQSNFNNQLKGIYPKEEIGSFFQWLAEAYLGYSRFKVSEKKDEEISEQNETQFLSALTRLMHHEPIQYIIGETEFYGFPFKVTPAVLIPRPETEELVAWVLEEFKNQEPENSILDIGTGSGCIAISLARYLGNATISALDISEAAIEVARENSVINKVDVNFFQADILNAETLPQQYDAIVSNPPYVRQQEKSKMQPNVLQHEPEVALFVSNEDPLLFYRAIARLAKKHLTSDGTLYLEINEYLSKEMQQMLQQEGFAEIALKKDIFGKFRMLKCKLYSY